MVVDGLDEIVDLAVVEFDGLLGLLEGLLVLEGGSLVEEGKEGGADAPECLVDADRLDTEWVYVPEGSCDKIAGGTVAAVKPAK